MTVKEALCLLESITSANDDEKKAYLTVKSTIAMYENRIRQLRVYVDQINWSNRDEILSEISKKLSRIENGK